MLKTGNISETVLGATHAYYSYCWSAPPLTTSCAINDFTFIKYKMIALMKLSTTSSRRFCGKGHLISTFVTRRENIELFDAQILNNKDHRAISLWYLSE